MIATDVGGLAEVVIDGNTGAIIPPENPERLADAVCDFFDRELFDLYRSNVIEEKKKYSWDFMADGIERLYWLLVNRVNK